MRQRREQAPEEYRVRGHAVLRQVAFEEHAQVRFPPPAEIAPQRIREPAFEPERAPVLGRCAGPDLARGQRVEVDDADTAGKRLRNTSNQVGLRRSEQDETALGAAPFVDRAAQRGEDGWHRLCLIQDQPAASGSLDRGARIVPESRRGAGILEVDIGETRKGGPGERGLADLARAEDRHGRKLPGGLQKRGAGDAGKHGLAYWNKFFQYARLSSGARHFR